MRYTVKVFNDSPIGATEFLEVEVEAKNEADAKEQALKFSGRTHATVVKVDITGSRDIKKTKK